MAETTTPPLPSRAVSRPVSEALLNEKVSIPPRCDRLNLTIGTVGPLPLQPHHQVLPRPRLRRRLLGAPVQAEGVARLCRRWVRRRAGVRGVQLQPQGGGAGHQEAGIKRHGVGVR